MTEGTEVSLPARPVRKPLSSQTAETWGFYYWSLGVCGILEEAGPVPNFVKRYLSTGCG